MGADSEGDGAVVALQRAAGLLIAVVVVNDQTPRAAVPLFSGRLNIRLVNRMVAQVGAVSPRLVASVALDPDAEFTADGGRR